MRRLIALLFAAVVCMTPVMAAGDGNSLQVHMQTGVKETPKSHGEDAVAGGTGGKMLNQSGSAVINESLMGQGPGKTSDSSLSSSGQRIGMALQQEQQALDDELSAVSQAQQEVLQNQNRVRLAVQVLFAACNEDGEIGRQISSIADELNNSVRTTIMAEERIRERNLFVRFFAGGDQEAAGELIRQVEENRIRLEELRQLVQQGGFDGDVISILQEQVMNIEAEQNRLRTLAEEENQNRGIFGFIFQ